ncbi:MAG: acyltransferase [Candidatus Woesearchaeota archaeon]|nr:MAG: acyltransferase [Candidatus Woesearchaeota archaeon]
MTTKCKRIGSIDILRVVAIILIVAFHCVYSVKPNEILRGFGLIGLSLFFIISGYLLAKKYPDLNKFNPKWFLKRFVKIVSFYYPALIALMLVFGRQVYWGSAFKNILYHFLFIDFISPETRYTITSASWFLIPLIALYLLFPYINALLKKRPNIFPYIFLMTVIVRIFEPPLTPYALYGFLFFIGEFGFGILLAQNKKLLPLTTSFLIILASPYMIIPFVLFYFVVSIPVKSHKIISIIGANTIAIFLFHEAFIQLIIGKWHIYSLSTIPALILLSSIAVILIYFSKSIQHGLSKIFS